MRVGIFTLIDIAVTRLIEWLGIIGLTIVINASAVAGSERQWLALPVRLWAVSVRVRTSPGRTLLSEVGLYSTQP